MMIGVLPGVGNDAQIGPASRARIGWHGRGQALVSCRWLRVWGWQLAGTPGWAYLYGRLDDAGPVERVLVWTSGLLVRAHVGGVAVDAVADEPTLGQRRRSERCVQAYRRGEERHAR